MKFRLEMKHADQTFVGEGDRLYPAIKAIMTSIEKHGCEVAQIEFAASLYEIELIAKKMPDELGKGLFEEEGKT